MLGFPSILSLFRNEFNKFNNIIARKVDSIYHVILKLICSRVFCCENAKILQSTGHEVILHGLREVTSERQDIRNVNGFNDLT